MDKKARLRTVNSKTDEEWNNHDKWRKRAILTQLHHPKSRKDSLKYLKLIV